MDIRVTGIVKEFGDTAALRDVGLDVRSGELMALLGPSGSGKTTLLRVIAGLEIAERGKIFFGGQDATRLSVQQRQVGFVFQHYALFRHLSVADNIAYGLRARPRHRRPGSAEIKKRVDDLLDLVQLGGLQKRFPAQLSGGQRQRVALARALAVEPRVLLLDEPFGALDARVRKDLRRWLREIHHKTNQTTIFVTHDQDEALELADRVAILNQGRIEQVGTPDEIQDNAASPFVMSFVGDAAKFDARSSSGRVFVGEKTVDVGAKVPDSEKIALYSRPWQLRLAAPGEGHLDGTVHATRRAGRHYVVTAEANGELIDIESQHAPADGTRVGIIIDSGRVFAG
ncbi:sulfate/thiosulfate import ATP-binding protein CysA [Variibacter gotjawalensis]|uniref:Sulfate/thiosulfate import ATP-binding protein CysA n=1 Tax=Variibacter gotjawalensis TaxID=1333996 RepID=A0A0S3PQY9_9BRAD|nr:sulfate ABC transporter ATP-binding protein [Variibacter gotjawalensis]NIK48608.1 sulfate transport system ATP-binding protein [Variibacter gotjawalensis]RZS50473.1 sulfate transport system ATP-binding protein [Variibacter gotjawalensis]BAT58307.1 sulfate/thiosulfate import ATP-binding protein CysA [Variibacter gotjawalensis]